MDTSEGSVNRIGRTIWTVWGYLSGAVARYLSPEVTDSGNQNVNSTPDTVNRNTAKKADRPVKEIDAENDKEETKYNRNENNPAEARFHVATAEWEKTEVVKEDNNEIRFDTTITQSYHCETDHKQTDEAIASDDQVNYENEEKQTEDEAHIKNKVAISIENRANIELDGSEPEQKLKETEDTEKKDGYSEDRKEDFDHYNEDDGEEGVMKTEALDDTEVTDQSVQDEQKTKTLMTKMESEETEDIRSTEDARDLIKENVVEFVIDKEEQIVYTDQEKTESVTDKGTESLLKDEEMPSNLGCLREDEEGISKPLENKMLRLMEEYSENILENEGVQTQERQVIDDISKNVFEIPGTSDTSELDKNIENRANIELDVCEPKQELKETEDSEQKDGYSEDRKEDFDHYNEDDGEEGVMKTEALDDTEVTDQSVQDEQKTKTLMTTMESEETEHIQSTEDAKDLLRENVVEFVIDKEEQIVYTDQEKTEIVEDKGPESLLKDEALPSNLGCSREDEEDLSKPLENKMLRLMEEYSENILENEGVQAPETRVIDDISKNVVEIPETSATSEPDKNIENRANIELDVCEPEQELKETEDSEQKDGYSEDRKEDFDPYNEDDGEEGVMKREALDDTEVTDQSIQDVEQKTLMTKMKSEETEHIRSTEDARDLLGENIVEFVIDKDEQIVYVDQEKTESVEDKGPESLLKDEELPSNLGCSRGDEEDLSKPLENKMIRLMEEYSENTLENEGVQAPERRVIDDISKSMVEIPGTSATSESDKNIEEDEQQKWLDAGEFPGTEILGEKEAHGQMLGENQTLIQTQSLELVETSSGGSKEICDDSIAHSEIELKTHTFVNEVVDVTFVASDDTLQSDLLKQDSPETANLLPLVADDMHSDLTVCELPRELSNRPVIGSVNTGDLDQITAVATSLGFFDDMKAISELQIPAEDRSQSSVLTPCEPLNDTFVEAAEIEQGIETPKLSLEIGANQIQTLKEMAKCSLKECAELRSEQIGETMKTETDSEEKREVLMTCSEADNEVLELNIEKECILSQAAMETISEPLYKNKWESSEHDVNRTELVEDSPDAAEAKTELLKSLSPAEVLEETQYLEGKSERYTENIRTEVGLLSETDSMETTVEDVEKIINQVLKELIETENKCIQETPSDAEFQKPAECLLEGKKDMLGDAAQSLVQMEVETVICEAVEKQKDEHDIICPECEPADADGGCEQKERDTVGETLFPCHDENIEIDQPGLKTFDNTSQDLPEVETEEQEVDWSATVDLDIQQTSLDFSVQKSRIALKNPLTRPPKDPRKLINKTSTEPSLQKPPACGLLKAGHGVAVSVQSKGFIGIKLPVVGQLPTLRKTEFGKKVREEGTAESRLQVESKSVAETENSVKQEQASLKPKWTPPKHPGMGSPLMMAELKRKLKTPVKE